MQLEVYQRETEVMTHRQVNILESVCKRLKNGEELDALEENGVLHALQLLIENAIGKAKHLLKSMDIPVPTSAYDTFKELAQQKYIEKSRLDEWYAIIGLRNKIVHDYMNIDMRQVYKILDERLDRNVVEFLLQPVVK